MASEKLIQFLQSTGRIAPQQAREIAGSFASLRVGKNDFFLRAGKISDEYFFLDTGFMRAFAHNPAGDEVTTAFYGGGQVVFEVSSFFNRIPSQENMQALTDCTGWFITFQELNGLFHSREEFREFGRSLLVKGYAGLKSRMLAMITESATERYERLLKENPEVVQHAPLKSIASYLGITDSSLSRIRAGSKNSALK
ncbi:Crp/Fnr family transcriptional regulator [Hymenobacter arizonensis]|uniref:cAMP-binding domain of CRP or a regulatory subunit of cAMP-dependent protein kinases n=1 Tax=Hymenobacter arizonensis TaxID=1227077 RepID=A0A1I5UFL6_HYMAR|nr:Crp/Fnr family transcriptional regulator [Hymenobacter arizonensis]SFP93948.1 cAMP-binding domain of CRP or a regulatory subunit of cAMP-dependent protein kinases [Hymenobacter arizonensis]